MLVNVGPILIAVLAPTAIGFVAWAYPQANDRRQDGGYDLPRASDRDCACLGAARRDADGASPCWAARCALQASSLHGAGEGAKVPQKLIEREVSPCKQWS
jgi:hypothetical protein